MVAILTTIFLGKEKWDGNLFLDPHHYTFILIATDLEPKELPPGLTRDELFAKLTGHTKGATGLVGLFGSP
jgi:phosphatidylethanolamine-binding protein (PEBP) family uncharacterized protein